MGDEPLRRAAEWVARENREGPARVLVDDPERARVDDLVAGDPIGVGAGDIAEDDLVTGLELRVPAEGLGVQAAVPGDDDIPPRTERRGTGPVSRTRVDD